MSNLKRRLDALMEKATGGSSVEWKTIDPYDRELWRAAFEQLLELMPDAYAARVRDYDEGRDQTAASRLLWQVAWSRASFDVSEDAIDQWRSRRAGRGEAVEQRKSKRVPLNFTEAECEYVVGCEEGYLRVLANPHRVGGLNYDFGPPEPCTLCGYRTFYEFRCCPLCAGPLARHMVTGQNPEFHAREVRRRNTEGIDPFEGRERPTLSPAEVDDEIEEELEDDFEDPFAISNESSDGGVTQ